MSLYWNIFHDNFSAFARGALLTIELTAVSLIIAMFIGLFVAFMKLSKVGW